MQGIEKAADVLGTFNNHAMAVIRYLIIAVVAIIAVIMMCAVFWRYALDNSIPWSEEISKYLMVWLAFLGAPVALRHANHISIDLLMKAFPPRGEQVFHVLVNGLILLTMGIVFWMGVKFTELGARQVASSIQVSMLYMYIAVPIGSLLTCLVALEHLLRGILGIADPTKGLDLEPELDEIRE